MVGAIIYSRADSKRLPNKCFLKIHNMYLFEYIYKVADKLKDVEVILATTKRKCDDELSELGKTLNFNVYRGEYEDIAKRTIDCANYYGLDNIIRLNGDSPFLNLPLLNSGIKVHLSREAQFTSNLFNRKYPYGISCEILSTNYLKDVYPKMNFQEKEHFTSYLYKNVKAIKNSESLELDIDLSKYRLTIDTQEDYQNVKKVINRFKYQLVNKIDIKELIKKIYND